MSRRPLIEGAALAQVVRRYPALGTFTEVLRNGLSTNSAACTFTTDMGTYFAKRYDADLRDPYSIASEHGIILQLREANFPTPLLHANNRGDTITWLAEVPYAIFGLAHGEDRYGELGVFEPFRDREDARAAGRMLARFHQILAVGLLPPPKRFRGFVAQFALYGPWRTPPMDGGEPAEHALATLDALLADQPALLAFVQAQPEWEGLRGYVAARADALVPLLSELPRGIIHGDWIKRNLFWETSEVAAVLDFDLWNVGPFLYDMAVALLPCGFNWPAVLADDLGPDAVDHADMMAMMAGYQEVRHLSPEERQALPLIMETARVEFYLSIMTLGLAKNDGVQVAQFWRLLCDTTAWFTRHPDWRAALD